MQCLDPLYTPLTGLNFIEASAGTGKTYTITALYLRLVMEEAIPVNRILVVTYTNAATKELRDRIRTRLAQIRLAFQRGRADADDEFSVRMLDLFPNRDLAIRRLTNAVRGFDEAAIFTIHGFCKRVLGDNAFESGLSFETELMTDTSDLLQEIVDDFWRREFYRASPMVVQYFLDKKYSPEKLLSDIRRHLGKPYLEISTPEGETDGAVLEHAFLTAYQQTRQLWQDHRIGIEELLLKSPALNRQKYGLKSIPGWLNAMDNYLTVEIPKLELFDKFDRFTTAKLQASVNKGKSAPQHPFFDACETLQAACETLADYCRHQIPVKLLAYCNAELAVRKRQQQTQSYDDLLLNLHDALKNPRQGAVLAETLRRRYAAALIDEFQDTDPVQYDIFRSIYASTGKPVFLVGDPKQAIYSFRGADIFAYINARRDTAHGYTLDVNWRSDPRLLTALNAVFGTVKTQPFLFDEILFQPAIPAEKKQHEPLWIQGQLEPPLQLWFVDSADPKEPMGKGEANEWAARATAAEISRLLNLGAHGQARIGKASTAEGSRPLAGGDIAVLVRSHRQGRLIRDHLLRLRVPSVQHADDSVLTTAEAQHLEWVLAAVAEPGDEGRVRAALASDLVGMSGEALYQLRDDEQAWARQLETFQDYRRLWHEHGFMRFFRTWLMDAAVAPRLLAFRDGERRLTNVLHLAELLHVASRTHPGMAGLLKWLGDHRRTPAKNDEEQQLRLESDENLVRIVTVHKSKGLEYSVVFCPFVWDGKLHVGDKEETLLYHDPAHPGRTILAVGLDEADPARHYARREEMAENLRLFYVALTRAKQRCYLVWGKIKDADSAPAAWLLHRPTVKDSSHDWLQATQERFKKMETPAIRNELRERLTAAGATVAIAPLPREPGRRYQPPNVTEPELKARSFAGLLPESWRVGSFTALTAGHSVETPDYDMSVGVPAVEAESAAALSSRRDIFTFPRGARSGVCLHALFERLDFTQHDREQLEALVSRTLTGHGLDAAAWTPTIADLVERVLATPLNESGLTLASVTPERRLNELEFTYPLAQLRADSLRRVLERHGLTAEPFREMIEKLEFNPLRGYMKGFMDLVFEAEGRFYLVDYKSNWLGAELAAYRRASLDEAMARDSYVLQYLIYTVALHRYLRLRVLDYDYERHFGGVFYLFLRGMNPESGPDCGVYQNRPSLALVKELDRLMATGRIGD
ncbi:exodeoxyribonuclease V subunit beta [Candidatus Contendibacter odensensis]|uniref:RecBCD enzyme subunit RecB n=1 Tax=Candidatus Contendobacter odensis Run_B_J11 TaxID=1400861 RepID=A0A7U7GE78_9GAMM|nr:exodeoxyribonuclease V subunit beta [Candidatus Contendobacter odensis]CDH46751.1 putative Exodeoxyribonuclease V beta chain [Candidatus Contendobacter odensis Run_B_J11]